MNSLSTAWRAQIFRQGAFLLGLGQLHARDTANCENLIQVKSPKNLVKHTRNVCNPLLDLAFSYAEFHGKHEAIQKKK